MIVTPDGQLSGAQNPAYRPSLAHLLFLHFRSIPGHLTDLFSLELVGRPGHTRRTRVKTPVTTL